MAWTVRACLTGALLSGLVLTGCGGSRPPHPASSTTTASGVATSTSTGPTTTSTRPSTPAGLGPYQPLFPFATATAVDGWRDRYAAGGHEPWHLDSGLTAVAFARWLGFAAIDRATSVKNDRTGAHIGVGFELPDHVVSMTAAVVHLVRWGTGPDAPWEAVGTDDTTFSVTAPAYGAMGASPVRVGGRISGVDESIGVEVRSTTSGAVLGATCCRPAGGMATP
ncbi:MAG TPA: hypothetical protein VHL53_17165, partial [Acidimicrobiia bacterium]|nr:hypothetical protein [Acidimicrobiia bacterium]